MLAREAYDNVPVGSGPAGYGQPRQKPATYNSPAARDADMQLYDSLGPLSRQAIDESPGEIIVSLMLTQAPMEATHPSGWGWDDKRLSQWIRGQVQRRYGKPASAYVLEPVGSLAARRRL